MISIEEKVYNKLLSSNHPDALSRYHHSLLVADEMQRIAISHHLDISLDQIFLTGLVHDYAKYVSADYYLNLQNKYPQIKEELTYPDKIKHAILAPYILREELDIKDSEVLEAVKYHSTGKKQMSLLGEMLFVADYSEITRQGETHQLIREIVIQSIKKATAMVLDFKIKFIENKNQYLHPLTREAYLYYKKYL